MVMKKDNYDKAMDVLEKQYNMESGTMPMSAEQEEKYAAMIKEVVSGNDSRKSDMRHKKKRMQTLSAFPKVAIVLICFAVVGVATAPSADAVRLKIQQFFSWEEEGNTVLVPSDTEAMEDRENYFLLSSLPDGYVQTYAEDIGQYKTIVYESDNDSIVLEQKSASTVISVDNETTDFEEVTLLGNKGQYCNNESDAVSTIFLLKGDYLLTVYTRGEGRLRGEELIEFLNRNLTFVK